MTTTAGFALLLAENVHALSLREDAGRCRNDILRLVDSIEKMVNRPRPRRYAGNCLRRDENEQPCGTPLYAEKHDDKTVECWRCHTEYVIDDLIQAGLDSARGWLFSEVEAREIMAQIGKHIPRGTWWSWKDRGLLENRNEWGAEPKYLLEEVMELYEQRVGKRNTA